MNNVTDRQIIIDDTTLRDGEQTAGVVFSLEEKNRQVLLACYARLQHIPLQIGDVAPGRKSLAGRDRPIGGRLNRALRHADVLANDGGTHRTAAVIHRTGIGIGRGAFPETFGRRMRRCLHPRCLPGLAIPPGRRNYG